MKLEENKIYTGKELAEWFGVQYSTFKNTKEKKLEELKYFADYELVGNKTKKYKIIKVYNPVYMKSVQANYGIIREKVDREWDSEGLDTCSRVSQAIYESQEYWPIAPGTMYNYTCRSRNELFGDPKTKEEGLEGYCEYEFAKQVKDSDRLTPFTLEEKAIEYEIMDKYYGAKSEEERKQQDLELIEQTLLINARIEADSKYMTEDEVVQAQSAAWRQFVKKKKLNSRTVFLQFLTELETRIHCKVVRGTRVYRNGIYLNTREKGEIIDADTKTIN